MPAELLITMGVAATVILLVVGYALKRFVGWALLPLGVAIVLAVGWYFFGDMLGSGFFYWIGAAFFAGAILYVLYRYAWPLVRRRTPPAGATRWWYRPSWPATWYGWIGWVAMVVLVLFAGLVITLNLLSFIELALLMGDLDIFDLWQPTLPQVELELPALAPEWTRAALVWGIILFVGMVIFLYKFTKQQELARRLVYAAVAVLLVFAIAPLTPCVREACHQLEQEIAQVEAARVAAAEKQRQAQVLAEQNRKCLRPKTGEPLELGSTWVVRNPSPERCDYVYERIVGMIEFRTRDGEIFFPDDGDDRSGERIVYEVRAKKGKALVHDQLCPRGFGPEKGMGWECRRPTLAQKTIHAVFGDH